MALNRYMHPRNIFRQSKISFAELAKKYDFLQKAIQRSPDTEECAVNFKNPSEVAALTRAILKDYFDLDIHLRTDRLIPTVPLRLNYILWLEDILKGADVASHAQINILDIGCGASCIYPLLGATKNKEWSFVATETDAENVQEAKRNINNNNFNDRIIVLKTEDDTETTSLLSLAMTNDDRIYHLLMCNPPFYFSSTDQVGSYTTRTDERDEPKSGNFASSSECVTWGGDAYFAMRLINESVLYKDRIRIFTIMLGRKQSVAPVKKVLATAGVTNFSVHEMCQGRVMRWGVAWTFDPSVKFMPSEFQSKKKLNMHPLTWVIPRDIHSEVAYTKSSLYSFVKELLQKIQVRVLDQKTKQKLGGGFHLLVWAEKDTWSHQRRQRRMNKVEQKGAKLNGSLCEEKSSSPPCKKRKFDACIEQKEWYTDEKSRASDGVSEASSSASCSNALLCKFTIHILEVSRAEGVNLVIEMNWLEGGNKESMNQIMTYIRNNLKRKPM